MGQGKYCLVESELIGASCQENGTALRSTKPDARLLMLKRWVLRFCCAIGNQGTDFSRSAWPIPSNYRIFSQMRRCQAAVGMNCWLRPTRVGISFGSKDCGFRNDSSLQNRPNVVYNGVGNGFNCFGAQLAMHPPFGCFATRINLPRPLVIEAALAPLRVGNDALRLGVRHAKLATN